MFNDILTLVDFFKFQNKAKRVFFFENSFIESHLEPYVFKNKNLNNTIIISLYKIEDENLKKFKIFHIRSIFFLNLVFLVLKIKFCYSSTPDIDNSAFKRSLFKKTKYIYIQHSPLGLYKIYRDNAFTNFDVVQVVNIFQKKDLMYISKIKNKKIKPWCSKYLFLSNKNFTLNISEEKKRNILIAPTWGTNFFNLKTHIIIQNKLDTNKYNIFIRPHAMSIKNKNISIKNLKENKFQIADGKINFFQFDLLITDWSGIYIEFAKIKKIRSILVQNTEKILNTKFNEFHHETIDKFARNKLGKILNIDGLNNIESEIDNILLSQTDYTKEINNFFERYFY